MDYTLNKNTRIWRHIIRYKIHIFAIYTFYYTNDTWIVSTLDFKFPFKKFNKIWDADWVKIYFRQYNQVLYYKYFETIELAERKNEMSNKTVGFNEVIKALKHGKRAQRSGWNGKSQYIELAENISYKCCSGEIVNVEHDAIGNKAIAFVGTSGVQIGWLASQADMLAEDWIIM